VAIDFDGTNDGLDVDISAFGATISSIFLHGYFHYDTAGTIRNIVRFRDSGDNTKFVRLTRTSGTVTLRIQNGTGNQRNYGISGLSAGTWYGFQMYAIGTSGTLYSGLRIWNNNTIAGAWDTVDPDAGTPLVPSNLDTCHFGYNGLGLEFWDGRLAEFWLHTAFDPEGTTGDSTGVPLANALGNNNSPLYIMSPVYDYFGALWHYWPMRSASHLTDVFNKAALTLVDAPASHLSHPKIKARRFGRSAVVR